MKILIISGYFPPNNSIGANRVGSFFTFLKKQGCDVRVICASEKTLRHDQKKDLEKEHIYCEDWLDPHRFFHRRTSYEAVNKNINVRTATFLFDNFYKFIRSLLHWPDRHMFWSLKAKKRAEKLFVDWWPDVIYASASPVSSLFVAKHLSKKYSIPWIAEMRDLWTDNPYNEVYFWRRLYDQLSEQKLFKNVSFFVTVSKPLASILEQKFSKKAYEILNGYQTPAPDQKKADVKTEHLHIVYTGMIYPGKRDPAKLFQAIKKLGPLSKKIKVCFYGSLLPGLNDLINRYDVREQVEIYGRIPNDKILEIQYKADILLLLLWDSPKEEGVYTGKLFEYLGARRPILTLGLEDGVAASLIRERNAGVVTNDVDQIASALKAWLVEKEKMGFIRSLDLDASKGLSRVEQFTKLIPKIRDLCGSKEKKRKIIFVIKGLEIGGTERHLIGLIPRLARNFDVSVFSFYHGTILKNNFETLAFDSSYSRTIRRKKCTRIIAIFNLCRLLAKNQDAIVHFFLPEPYIVGGICSILFGIPNLIMSRRSLNLYQQNYWFIQRIEKILHKKMRVVLANSKAVVSDLISEDIPETKISLIYNAVETYSPVSAHKRTNMREQLGFKMHELIIVCVANLLPYKGHSDLLEGLANVSQQLPHDWKLILIGRDEGYKIYLEKKIDELGLASNVVFEGEKLNSSDYFNISDIGVLPSHQEGFSNSILEGMASGLPMVVSDVGGNSEAIDNKINGLVVPAKSPSDLGNALLALALDERMRKNFGRAARLKVDEEFTWEKCVKKYEQVYLQDVL